MFCPRCGAEYREGFTECADCHVPLTDAAPPPPEEPQYADLVPVMATYNLSDIAIVKSTLESEDIPHFFEGEMFNTVRPFVQPVRLFVPRSNVDEVVEILRGLRLKFFSLSGHSARCEGEDDLPDDEPQDAGEPEK